MKSNVKKQIRICIIGITLFTLGVAVSLIIRQGILEDFEVSFTTFIQKHQPASIVTFFKIISNIELLLVPLVIGMFIYLLLKRKRDEACIVLCSGIIAVAISFYLKHIFQIPRPDTSEIIPIYESSDLTSEWRSSTDSFGYPSGHAFSYTIILGSFYYLIREFVKTNKLRRILTVITLSVILLVGLSRVSLGAHYPSQVIGGYLLALGILIPLVYAEHIRKRIHTKSSSKS